MATVTDKLKSKSQTRRVTSAYIPGTRKGKPPGCSELYFKEVISKSDEACTAAGLVEQVQIDVCNVLLESSEYNIDPQFLELLGWITTNIYSFWSFCFMTANSDDHVFDELTLDSIHNLTIKLQNDSIDSGSDFIEFDDHVCLLISQLRVTLRMLESAYVRWTESQRVSVDIRETTANNPELVLVRSIHRNRMGEILNRLSSTIYWGARRTYEMNCDPNKGFAKEWKGFAKEFRLTD